MLRQAFWVNQLKTTTIIHILPQKIQLRHLYAQILGTFVMTMMVQIINQKKMTFIEHNRQFYVCIPIFLMIARQFSSISNGLNPATGFAFEFAYCIFTKNWTVFSMVYILMVGPVLGALISVFLFQFLLKPLYPLKRAEIQKQLQQYQKRRLQQQQYVDRLSQRRASDLSQLNQRRQTRQRLSKPNLKQLIDHTRHKYTLNEIINLQPKDQIYQQIQDNYIFIQEEKPNQDVDSVGDDQQKGDKFSQDFQELQRLEEPYQMKELTRQGGFDSEQYTITPTRSPRNRRKQSLHSNVSFGGKERFRKPSNGQEHFEESRKLKFRKQSMQSNISFGGKDRFIKSNRKESQDGI